MAHNRTQKQHRRAPKSGSAGRPTYTEIPTDPDAYDGYLEDLMSLYPGMAPPHVISMLPACIPLAEVGMTEERYRELLLCAAPTRRERELILWATEAALLMLSASDAVWTRNGDESDDSESRDIDTTQRGAPGLLPGYPGSEDGSDDQRAEESRLTGKVPNPFGGEPVDASQASTGTDVPDDDAFEELDDNVALSPLASILHTYEVARERLNVAEAISTILQLREFIDSMPAMNRSEEESDAGEAGKGLSLHMPPSDRRVSPK
jgi:hypothetical protein